MNDPTRTSPSNDPSGPPPTASARFDRPSMVLLARRAAACVLDYGVFAALAGPYVFFAGESDGSGRVVVTGTHALFPVVLWVFLFPFTESCFSTSLGKRLFHLRIVSVDGRPLTFGRHLKRRLLDPIDLFTGNGLLAAVLFAVTANRQRLGDLWAFARVEDSSRSSRGPDAT